MTQTRKKISKISMARNELDHYISLLAKFEARFSKKTADVPEYFEQWEGDRINRRDFQHWRLAQERVKILVAKLGKRV